MHDEHPSVRGSHQDRLPSSVSASASTPWDDAAWSQLRLAAALAHAVSGVALAVRTAEGREVVVAHHRLDAHLTPCQFRQLVLSAVHDAPAGGVERIAAVTVTGGLDDLGGGIYRRLERGREQRIVATVVAREQLIDLFAGCPLDVPDDAVGVNLSVDVELGATVVTLSAEHDLWAWRLDELAFWLQASCMVAELTAAIAAS